MSNSFSTYNVYNSLRSSLPPDFNYNLYYNFFSPIRINYISEQITTRLIGVHPEGKNIIVPESSIISVMDSIYQSTFRDVDKMTMMTIEHIVAQIKDEYENIAHNNSLNIWITNYPAESNMRQTPQIKLREKRPSHYDTSGRF